MNVQQAIAQFLEHGQSVRNLSDRTLRAYHSDLSQFHLHMDDMPTVEITARGSRLTAKLDGKVIAEADDSKYARGPVAIQAAGGPVRYRNIQIRPLK